MNVYVSITPVLTVQLAGNITELEDYVLLPENENYVALSDEDAAKLEDIMHFIDSFGFIESEATMDNAKCESLAHIELQNDEHSFDEQFDKHVQELVDFLARFSAVKTHMVLGNRIEEHDDGEIVVTPIEINK